MITRFKSLSALGVLGLTLISGIAQAENIQKGDVFASVASGSVQHYRYVAGVLTLLETMNTGLGGFTTGMAFDKNDNLYLTMLSAGKIVKFDNANTSLSGIFATAQGTPESLVFDMAGNLYNGNVFGPIAKYDSAGNLLSTTTVPRGDWIDLAKDQKTMYVTGEGGTITRFDVSTNTQLSDFASPGGRAFALRILGDGSVLLADGASVLRLDAAGNTVQTYNVLGENTWFALNLDPDGKSFWSGDYGTSDFYKFDIASGAVLDSKNTGTATSTLFGLSVAGEITQGGGGGVPEPGTVAMLIGLGVSGAGIMLRKRK